MPGHTRLDSYVKEEYYDRCLLDLFTPFPRGSIFTIPLLFEVYSRH